MKKKKPSLNTYSVCVIRTSTVAITIEVKAANEDEAEDLASDEADSSANEDKWTWSERTDVHAVLKARGENK